MKEIDVFRASFAEAIANPDRIARAQELADPAREADLWAEGGREKLAVEAYRLLETVDPYDDLVSHIIDLASDGLVRLGARKLPTVEELIAECARELSTLPEQQRLIATAKFLMAGQRADDPQVWRKARDLLDEASNLGSLTKKQLRFKAEVNGLIERQ